MAVPRLNPENKALLINGSATGEPVWFGGGSCAWVRHVGTGGSALRLEMLSPNGTTWMIVQGTQGTTDLVLDIALPAGMYRAAITGGTNPSGYSAALLGVL